ncbi:phosphoribosyl-atp diphosphatase [Plasmopara halstedii]|uniref:Phosphoribosyl-atp diphosphatase n=1 Tax=Plasmopara halstedii TaxID=4781 RepID=A0A0P1ABD3_PLAHL|nr:phosphoribosyl-atp diphosphatase [Plasmopara halstedii]CEG37735.1 phosphoribosyl-atp diphosphatase [Plasmopara halstedii]|eukprot:XP_024574104.1 phosphoribosyl-atp diphosphatase [Plasmopara halstedii]
MLIPKYSSKLAATADTQCSLLRRFSMLGLVLAELSSSQLRELALALPAEKTKPHELELKASLLDSRTLLGPFSVEMIEPLISWLDQGTEMALVEAASSEDAELKRIAIAVSDLPANRLVLRIPVSLDQITNTTELQDKLAELNDIFSGVILVISSVSLVQEKGCEEVFANLEALRNCVNESFLLAVEMSSGSASNHSTMVALNRIRDFHQKHIHVVTSAFCRGEEDEPVDTVIDEGEALVDAGQAFVHCLRTDRPDGLFTTVVADEAGVALGLVYSSKESILAAIASGRGVYYSRSRGGLWKKGESSGNAQQLIKIDMDCDSDALRFTVNQTGAGFCHLNTRTCWGHDNGLRALESVLFSRHADAPAGSYTKRLFEDAKLLRNKLVEEAQELAEAETIPDVAGEAADVMYFAMVRCVAAGCKLSDVEKMLDKRSLKVKRRPGNSKAHRISAANDILNSKEPALL